MLVPDSEEFFAVEVIDSVIRITVVVKFLKKIKIYENTKAYNYGAILANEIITVFMLYNRNMSIIIEKTPL